MPSWLAKAWRWRWWVFLLGVVIVSTFAWPGITTWLKNQFPGKNKWDYLEKIVIPVIPPMVIAFGIWYLDKSARNRGQERQENETKERDRIRIEESKSQALQSYFDRISDFLIEKQVISLAEAAKRVGPNYKDPVAESARDVIRAQTLTILRVFSEDTEKKSSVIRFLIDSKILASLTLSLAGANLSGVNLVGANLSRVRLVGANLSMANLVKTDLIGARLSTANLSMANLNQADLSEADLSMANLIEIILSGAVLKMANLSVANLSGANLEVANLAGTVLNGAYLSEANLSGASLIGASLIGANLAKANLNLANLNLANLNLANLRETDLRGLEWNDKTIWPPSDHFEGAKNIPAGLKEKLGL